MVFKTFFSYRDNVHSPFSYLFTVRSIGALLAAALLAACAGGGGGGGGSRSVAEFSRIQPAAGSVLLNWTNPSLSAREGIYRFTIEYEAVGSLSDAGIGAFIDAQLGRGLERTNRSVLVSLASAARESRILDWDGDGVLVGDLNDPTAGDNCLSVANAAQADADRDGVGDACDGLNSSLSFVPASDAVRIRWLNPLQPLDAGGPREIDIGYAASDLEDAIVGENLTMSFSSASGNLTVSWTNPAAFYGSSAGVNITAFMITGGASPLTYMPGAGEHASGAMVSVELELGSVAADGEHRIEVVAMNRDGTAETSHSIGSGCVLLTGEEDKVAECGTERRSRVDPGSVVFVSNFTLRVTGPSSYSDRVVLSEDSGAAGVSFDYSEDENRTVSSVYLYNASGLVSGSAYSFELLYSYTNGSGSVREIDLSDEGSVSHSPVGFVYTGSVELGMNPDGDHLADRVDDDDDNDGILDTADSYDARSALTGEVAVEYTGNAAELGLYEGGSGGSHRLDGLAEGSYYVFTVRAHIRRYANEGLAEVLGYLSDGNLIPGAIYDMDRDSVEAVARSRLGTYIGSNADGDELADVLDVDDDNDRLTDALEPVDPRTNQSCRLSADCDGDGLDDNEEYYVAGEPLGGDGRPNLRPSVYVDAATGTETNCLLSVDCDGDTVNDPMDAFPTDPTESADGDRDGVGDNSDNCPFVANARQADADEGTGDGRGDLCEGDVTVSSYQYRGSAARRDLTVVPDRTEVLFKWKNVPLASNVSAEITGLSLDWRVVVWNATSDEAVRVDGSLLVNSSGMVDIFDTSAEYPVGELSGYSLLESAIDSLVSPSSFEWYSAADRAYRFRLNVTYGSGAAEEAVLVYGWTEYVWLLLNTDGDEYSDFRDLDDDNDGLSDEAEGDRRNAANVLCSLLADCDEDMVGDAEDAFPTDPTESADGDRDGIGDNADNFAGPGLDEDGDRVVDSLDSCLLSPLNGLGGTAAHRADGDEDGISAVCDSNVTVPNAIWFTPDTGSVIVSWRNPRVESALGFRISYREEGSSSAPTVVPVPVAPALGESDLGWGNLSDYGHYNLSGLSDGTAYYFSVNLTYDANGSDYELLGNLSDSLYSVAAGINADGDYLADRVDEDDDNDGLLDSDAKERLVNADGLSCSRLVDCDGDGVNDAEDAFPADPTESADSDRDGTGDNADRFDANPLEVVDSDYDGVGDNADNCDGYYNPSQANADGDAQGDLCDADDDNAEVGRVASREDTYPDGLVEVVDPMNENGTINQTVLSSEVSLSWTNPAAVYLPFALPQPLSLNLTDLVVEMRLGDGSAVTEANHPKLNVTSGYVNDSGDLDLEAGDEGLSLVAEVLNRYRVRGLRNGTLYRFEVIGVYDYEPAAYLRSLARGKTGGRVVLGVAEVETPRSRGYPSVEDLTATSGTDRVEVRWVNPVADAFGAALNRFYVVPCRYADALAADCVIERAEVYHSGAVGVSFSYSGGDREEVSRVLLGPDEAGVSNTRINFDDLGLERAYLYTFEVVIEYRVMEDGEEVLVNSTVRSAFLDREDAVAIYPYRVPAVSDLTVVNGLGDFRLSLTAPGSLAEYARIGEGIANYTLRWVDLGDGSVTDITGVAAAAAGSVSVYSRADLRDDFRLAMTEAAPHGLTFEPGRIYGVDGKVVYTTGASSDFLGVRVNVTAGPSLSDLASYVSGAAAVTGDDDLTVSWPGGGSFSGSDFEANGYIVTFDLGIDCPNAREVSESCRVRRYALDGGERRHVFMTAGVRGNTLSRGEWYDIIVVGHYNHTVSGASLTTVSEVFQGGIYPTPQGVNNVRALSSQSGVDLSWSRLVLANPGSAAFVAATGYGLRHLRVDAEDVESGYADSYNITVDGTETRVRLRPGDRSPAGEGQLYSFKVVALYDGSYGGHRHTDRRVRSGLVYGGQYPSSERLAGVADLTASRAEKGRRIAVSWAAPPRLPVGSEFVSRLGYGVRGYEIEFCRVRNDDNSCVGGRPAGGSEFFTTTDVLLGVGDGLARATLYPLVNVTVFYEGRRAPGGTLFTMGKTEVSAVGHYYLNPSVAPSVTGVSAAQVEGANRVRVNWMNPNFRDFIAIGANVTHVVRLCADEDWPEADCFRLPDRGSRPVVAAGSSGATRVVSFSRESQVYDFPLNGSFREGHYVVNVTLSYTTGQVAGGAGTGDDNRIWLGFRDYPVASVGMASFGRDNVSLSWSGADLSVSAVRGARVSGYDLVARCRAGENCSKLRRKVAATVLSDGSGRVVLVANPLEKGLDRGKLYDISVNTTFSVELLDGTVEERVSSGPATLGGIYPLPAAATGLVVASDAADMVGRWNDPSRLATTAFRAETGYALSGFDAVARELDGGTDERSRMVSAEGLAVVVFNDLVRGSLYNLTVVSRYAAADGETFRSAAIAGVGGMYPNEARARNVSGVLASRSTDGEAIEVEWTAPTDLARPRFVSELGYRVKDYTVRACPVSGSDSCVVRDGVVGLSSSLSASDGLTAGRLYTMGVRANYEGRSMVLGPFLSQPSSGFAEGSERVFLNPAVAPGVSGVVVRQLRNSVEVNWTNPDFGDFARVGATASWRIGICAAGEDCRDLTVIASGPDLSARSLTTESHIVDFGFLGLALGSSYRVEVRVAYSTGQTSSGMFSSFFTLEDTSLPRATVLASFGLDQVNASWTPPPVPAGYSLTGYRVRAVCHRENACAGVEGYNSSVLPPTDSHHLLGPGELARGVVYGIYVDSLYEETGGGGEETAISFVVDSGIYPLAQPVSDLRVVSGDDNVSLSWSVDTGASELFATRAGYRLANLSLVVTNDEQDQTVGNFIEPLEGEVREVVLINGTTLVRLTSLGGEVSEVMVDDMLLRGRLYDLEVIARYAGDIGAAGTATASEFGGIYPATRVTLRDYRRRVISIPSRDLVRVTWDVPGDDSWPRFREVLGYSLSNYSLAACVDYHINPLDCDSLAGRFVDTEAEIGEADGLERGKLYGNVTIAAHYLGKDSPTDGETKPRLATLVQVCCEFRQSLFYLLPQPQPVTDMVAEQGISWRQVEVGWTNPDLSFLHSLGGQRVRYRIRLCRVGAHGGCHTFLDEIRQHFGSIGVTEQRTFDLPLEFETANDYIVNFTLTYTDNGDTAYRVELPDTASPPFRLISYDPDGDGYDNDEDVDDDGDGLIEISTAAELNAMRYQLNGSGRRLSETAELNSTGCGDDDAITACNGYELVANISLADYRSGSGWQPVGRGSWDSALTRCTGMEGFNGIFDGNRHRVSNLKINRPFENCIGFFGLVEKGSEIRNFIIEAETITGQNIVGVLAGGINSTRAETSRVVNSHILADSLIGAGFVGGLVGSASITRIISSSSVLGSNRIRQGGLGFRGGLVGHGHYVWIISSSAVVGDITSIAVGWVGGLVGRTNNGRIISSYAIAGSLGQDARSVIGGLIGHGQKVKMVSSYGVTQSLSHFDTSGGLIGDGSNSRVTSSYTVSNLMSGSGATGIGPLTGARDENFGGIRVTSSYWDSDVNGITTAEKGTPQNSTALRMPTGYEGIYASWDDGADVDRFHSGVDDITIWCDNNRDGEISAAERTDANRIWDFGTSEQYPAIRCAPESPAEQRRWWYLNDLGKPILNRTRLDEVLP